MARKLSSTTFSFGTWQIAWSEAFCLSPLSICFVNYKPIVPGHILIIPRRVVTKFDDLTPAELSDLWTTAAHVSPKLRSVFNAQDMTFAIQDGKAAGQSVAHVHIHMLPRISGDFEENDEVYDRLDNTSLAREVGAKASRMIDPDVERTPRSKEEMDRESLMLRTFFVDFSEPIPEDE